MTLFNDHPERDVILINPRYNQTMRVKKGELPWSDLKFEYKIQSNLLFDPWFQKVLGFPVVTKKLIKLE